MYQFRRQSELQRERNTVKNRNQINQNQIIQRGLTSVLLL